MAEIRDLILAIIVMSGATVGLIGFVGGLTASYGANTPNITFMNKSAQINSQIAQYKTSTEGIKFTGNVYVDSILNIPIYIVTGIWNTILISLGMLDLYSALVTDLGNFGILLAWLAVVIIGSITVVIVFEIISLYMKRKA
jgi:hypothetical protein